MPRFGVCAWIYGDAALDATLGRIAAAGYDGVEIPGSRAFSTPSTFAGCSRGTASNLWASPRRAWFRRHDATWRIPIRPSARTPSGTWLTASASRPRSERP